MAKKNNNPQPVRATLTKILPSRLLPKAEIPLTETATELKDLGISESRIINLKDPRKIRRTTGAPLKPTERKGGPIPVDIVKDIAAYSKKYNVDPVEALGRAIVESQGRGWEYNNIFHILDNPIKNPAMTKLLRNYRSGTEAGIIAIKQKAQEFDNLVKRGKISKSHSPEKLNMLKLQMYNGLGLLTPDVEGAKGSLYGVKIPKEGLKMTERPLYAEELLDAMYMIRANPEVLDIIKNTKPAENTSQLGPLKNQNYTNYESAPLFDKGGLIKRKDGSYSRRGLWDNIRANRGSGRKPTAEMLRQERKIKAQKKEDGGWLDQYDDGSWVMDGAIPTPTTPSYYPAYPDRTLTTRQMGTPKAPMYAAGATVWTNQNTPLWAAGTPTPTSTQADYKNSRAISPESAVPYHEIKITGPTNPYMPASPPVLQGYNPYKGPMRLHAPDTRRMAYGGYVPAYKSGGFLRQAGEFAFGALEGTLDTVTGGMTDSLTDMTHDALAQAAGTTYDDKAGQRLKRLHGAGKIGGAITGAIVSGNVAGAIGQGAEGTNDILQYSPNASEDLKKWGGFGLNLAQQASGFMGGMNNTGQMAKFNASDIGKFAGQAGKAGQGLNMFQSGNVMGMMNMFQPQGIGSLKHGGRITAKYNPPGLRYQQLNPGVSAPEGIHTGPTTQRGITFGNGGKVKPGTTEAQAFNNSETVNITPNGDFRFQPGGVFYDAPPTPKLTHPTTPYMNKIPMRGMPSVSMEGAIPQKVNVPSYTNKLPAQYMDTRGEWSSIPQVPPVYTEEQLLKMGYRAPQKNKNGGWLDNL